MKKIFSFCLVVLSMFLFISCSSKNANAIELMGAGDRIHDSFTFANVGVKIKNDGDVYTIYGSVEKLDNQTIKDEFEIDGEVDHVVAIKLSAVNEKVDEGKVEISVNGVRSYDAEHLNGSNYTFIVLEAASNKTVSISVSWNGEKTYEYIVKFAEDLILK